VGAEAPGERVSVLDSVGGALVNASAAVDTFGVVDDSDVIHGDSSLGANIGASAASNTVVSDDLRHLIHL
jgi:hypothetical protein